MRGLTSLAMTLAGLALGSAHAFDTTPHRVGDRHARRSLDQLAAFAGVHALTPAATTHPAMITERRRHAACCSSG